MANAKPYTREIELEDKTLFSLVQEKGVLVEEGRAMSRELEELQKKMEQLTEKLGAKAEGINALKRKIINRCQKRASDLISEYEIPVTTEIRDGKLFLVITDTLEEFKGSFKNFDKWHEPVPRRQKGSTS